MANTRMNRDVICSTNMSLYMFAPSCGVYVKILRRVHSRRPVVHVHMFRSVAVRVSCLHRSVSSDIEPSVGAMSCQLYC